MEAVEAATDAAQLDAVVDKTLQHLQPLLTEGKHPEFDPNVLPFNVPKADVLNQGVRVLDSGSV